MKWKQFFCLPDFLFSLSFKTLDLKKGNCWNIFKTNIEMKFWRKNLRVILSLFITFNNPKLWWKFWWSNFVWRKSFIIMSTCYWSKYKVWKRSILVYVKTILKGSSINEGPSYWGGVKDFVLFEKYGSRNLLTTPK